MLKGGHNRHVVGLKHIETGGEDIRQLPLMHKDRRLPLAHRQLGAVFDLMAFTLKPPDHRVAGVVGPVNDVDELAREEIENAHGDGPYSFVVRVRYTGPSVNSRAMIRVIGLTCSAVMPGRRRVS